MMLALELIVQLPVEVPLNNTVSAAEGIPAGDQFPAFAQRPLLVPLVHVLISPFAEIDNSKLT